MKKTKKEVSTNLRKGRGFFRREKAITLIALVITIVIDFSRSNNCNIDWREWNINEGK